MGWRWQLQQAVTLWIQSTGLGDRADVLVPRSGRKAARCPRPGCGRGITRPWDFRRKRRGVAAHGDDVKHTPKSVQSEPAGAGRGLIPKRLGCFGGCGSEMA